MNSIFYYLIVFFCMSSGEHSTYCNHTYSFDLLSGRLFKLKPNDVRHITIQDTTYLINLLDCQKDIITIEVLINNKEKIMSGRYIVDNLDSITSYVVDPVTVKETKERTTYFLTLRDGLWKYWKVNGELLKKEYWGKGKLLRKELY